MTTCTPIFGLPVVEGSDRPCDIDDWSCNFASAVETQLDTLDAVVARTATTVPLVRVAMTVPRVISAANDDNVIINFDTVLADTDNMFNSATPDTITFNTPGMYSFMFNWRATSAGGGNQTAVGGTVFLTPGPTGFGSNFRPVQDNRQNQTGQPMYLSGHGAAPVTTGATSFLQIFLLVQGSDTISFNYVELVANWLGDLS